MTGQSTLFEDDKYILKRRAEELRREIAIHDFAYYVEAEPKITDRDYDRLMKELSDIESKYPELKTPESPTQRVGGQPLKEFNQVRHSRPMLSLANTYTRDEVIDFDRKIRDALADEEFAYSAELKYDGVAISLIYVDGKLSKAVTRGDGITGDDITQNIRTIKSVPLVANNCDLNGVAIRNFEVRGEVYMNEDDFLRFNEARQVSGEKTFANPRNTTAGTLKLLNPNEVASRPLQIVCYYLDIDNTELVSHSNNLDILKKLGFPVSPYSRNCRNTEDVFKYISEWEKRRNEIPFQIDGVVIKLDAVRQQKILGFVARSPRWAIAFKYEAEKAITKLNDISLQVGRTGVVTPVAELEPVLIAGSTISRATLHNYDYIRERDIRIGDLVIIEKGGEVIPKVTEVVFDNRPEGLPEYIFPRYCSCGLNSELIRPEGEANYYCEHPECPWQIRRRIEHFASRNAMNIDGLGEKVVDRLVGLNYVKSVDDLYELNKYRDELAKLSGWGEKSVDKLLNGIDKSKVLSLEKLIFALGIRFIGEGAARILARTYLNLDVIAGKNKGDFISVHEIGDKMADSLVAFFNDGKERKVIDKLRDAGLNFDYIKDESDREAIWSGKTFVLTGELTTMTRQKAKQEIELRGGKVTGTVSKMTTYVVAGNSPGSKLKKANELGIEILNEDDFVKLIV